MPILRDLLEQALVHHRRQEWIAAERLYEQVLRLDARQFDALHLLGVVRHQQGRHAEALELLGKALRVNRGSADAQFYQGLVLAALKRPKDALASYDRALAIKPSAEIWYNRANALKELDRQAAALESFERALAMRPDYVKALLNRGVVLSDLRRFDEALASFDRAIVLGPPDLAQAEYNRGTTLFALKRFEDAVAAYDRALSLRPDLAEAFNNRGLALAELRRFDEALASYDKALAVRPDHHDAMCNRALTLREMGRLDEALASCEQVLAVDAGWADAWSNRGSVLRKLNRLDETAASFTKALAIEPDHPYAYAGLADAALRVCDWEITATIARDLAKRVQQGHTLPSPFRMLAYCDDPALHLACAKRYIDQTTAPHAPLWKGQTFRNDKIRIGYLSADFQEHATAYLMAELFERHDRARFEIVGLSFGPAEGNGMRTRLVNAFDEFHDIGSKSDREAAELVHEVGVVIAVDLKGHTRDARPRILAHRPAPIQVNYLGYPGTMGARFIDYVVADQIVLPFDQQPYYCEKIVHLPECYQPNDSKRPIADTAPGRRDAGLPEHGFVFCCFNNNHKVTAPVFDVWMRLLRQTEGSVLWLLSDNEAAERNLRREAQARGVDAARLVFAGRMKLADHLARHQAADLFLDTLPYNAHTTASDALWAGLPLVTCQGAAFAGRVAASLLHAIGLPELVTHSLDEYEKLALRLARDASLLREFRERLWRNRRTNPLFDGARLARHLEAAYTTMHDIWQRGEKPRSFAIEAHARGT